MNAPTMVQMDRAIELIHLLEEMKCETNNKRFWELDRRFQEIVELNKLEDELNASAV